MPRTRNSKTRQKLPTLADTLYDAMGQNKEIEASAKQIAEMAGISNSSVTRILATLYAAGLAKRRFFRLPTEEQGPWTKGSGGRHVAWTLTGTREETRAAIEGSYDAYREQRAQEKLPAHVATETVQPQPMPVAEHIEQPVEIESKPKTVARSFEELAPLRKDESRAFIEVVRKFRDQRTFIEQERKRFSEMGLELGNVFSAFDAEQESQYRIVAQALPYIEGLERENQRLSEAHQKMVQPTNELANATRTIERQKGQIERLVSEKSTLVDEMRDVEGIWRGRLAAADRRIKDLEGQVADLRRERSAAAA